MFVIATSARTYSAGKTEDSTSPEHGAKAVDHPRSTYEEASRND